MIKNDNESSIDPFKVYIRVRPMLEKEITLIDSAYNNTSINNKQIINKHAVIAEDNMVLYYNN
jgi:hypothetical protein